MAELLERPRHDEDFYAWAIDQAKRLREMAAERKNEPVDWEELAEELEGVAKNEYSSARSYFTLVITHLLKISYSGRSDPLRHWCHEVRQFRENLDVVMTATIENRLRPRLDERYLMARDAAEIALSDDPSFWCPGTCPHSYEQIVGEWWPERVQDIVASFERR